MCRQLDDIDSGANSHQFKRNWKHTAVKMVLRRRRRLLLHTHAPSSFQVLPVSSQVGKHAFADVVVVFTAGGGGGDVCKDGDDERTDKMCADIISGKRILVQHHHHHRRRMHLRIQRNRYSQQDSCAIRESERARANMHSHKFVCEHMHSWMDAQNKLCQICMPTSCKTIDWRCANSPAMDKHILVQFIWVDAHI